jgi:hypothetical protein
MRKEMLPEHMTSGIKLKTASKAFLPEYTLSASILLVMRRPRIISTVGLLSTNNHLASRIGFPLSG